MSNYWHILKVKTGQELVAHELLQSEGFEVYTPFETKFLRNTQARRKNRTRIPYADPVFKGYLLFRFEDIRLIAALYFLMEHRSYLYGPLIAREGFYCLPDADIALLRETYPTGYDRRIHSRKNRQRKYAQAITVPKFERGDAVRFLEGPLAGIDMKVTLANDDRLRLLMTIFGSEREVEATAWELRKAG